MEDKHNHHHPPSNGFLMGVIVGGIATLLFTTKKGREIVKDLADKGFDKLSEFEKSINQSDVEEVLEIQGSDYIDSSEVERINLLKEERKENSQHTKPKPSSSPAKVKEPLRRFFKASKKN